MDITGSVVASAKVSSFINESAFKTINSQLQIDSQHSRPFSKEDCPIVAVEVVGFSPDRVLKSIDYQNSNFANTRDFCTVERLTKVNNVYPIYEYPYLTNANIVNYLLTDYVANAQSGKELFYQYETLFDVYSPDLDNAISIYKNGEFIVDKKTYILQFSNDLLGNSNARYSDTDWTSGIFTSGIKRTRILMPLEFAEENTYYVAKYTKSLYGAKIPTEELIELQSIYTQDTDFSITSSGLMILPSSKITSTDGSLYLIKNPDKRVFSNGITTIKDAGYQTDKTSSWHLKLNTGSFISRGSIFETASGIPYKLDSVYGAENIPIASTNPKLITENIIKLSDTPVYVDETKYSYPLYHIDIYDKSDTNVIDTTGKISIDINGKSNTNLTISSIDRNKGYLMLNNEINRVDQLEVTHYIKTTDAIILENFELNPKMPSSDSGFNISGYLTGFGIALRVYDSGNYDTCYPYVYDVNIPEESRICYQIKDINETGTSVAWSSNFFKITELYLNKLTPDILKITDARVIGGGVDLDNLEDDKDIVKEKEWYTNIGYYGGSPLPHSSTIIIHIPRENLDSLRTQWINETLTNNENLYDGTTQGTKAFNFHLDQTIRRYISAGSDYILLPTETDGTISGILNLEY